MEAAGPGPEPASEPTTVTAELSLARTATDAVVLGDTDWITRRGNDDRRAHLDTKRPLLALQMLHLSSIVMDCSPDL